MQENENILRDKCQQLLQSLLVDSTDGANYNEFNTLLLEIIAQPKISMNILKATIKL